MKKLLLAPLLLLTACVHNLPVLVRPYVKEVAGYGKPTSWWVNAKTAQLLQPGDTLTLPHFQGTYDDHYTEQCIVVRVPTAL